MRLTTPFLVLLAATISAILGLGATAAPAAGTDPTFGVDGRADLSRYYKSGVHSVESRGESIFVGSGLGNVVKLDRQGLFDAGFGGNGWADASPFVPWIDGSDYAPAMAVQKDGKVLAAGSWGPRPFLSRLTAEGEFDPTFADSGSTLDRGTFYKGHDRHINDIEIDARGRILVSGVLRRRLKGERVIQGFVTRYRPNGKVDRSFGKKGRVLYLGIKPPGVTFQAIEITRRGRIVVLRQNTKGTSAIALTPTGRRDRRFAKHRGLLRLPWTGSLDSLPGGRLYAFGVSPGDSTTGAAEGCARIFSFDWKGKRRSSFRRDGVRHICPKKLGRLFSSFEGESPSVLDAGFAVQGDGKPVVALALTGAGILSQPTIRLRAGGSIDRSFADQGLFRAQRPLGRSLLEGLPKGVLVNAGTLIAGDPLEKPYFYDDYIYRFGS